MYNQHLALPCNSGNEKWTALSVYYVRTLISHEIEKCRYLDVHTNCFNRGFRRMNLEVKHLGSSMIAQIHTFIYVSTQFQSAISWYTEWFLLMHLNHISHLCSIRVSIETICRSINRTIETAIDINPLAWWSVGVGENGRRKEFNEKLSPTKVKLVITEECSFDKCSGVLAKGRIYFPFGLHSFLFMCLYGLKYSIFLSLNLHRQD